MTPERNWFVDEKKRKETEKSSIYRINKVLIPRHGCSRRSCKSSRCNRRSGSRRSGRLPVGSCCRLRIERGKNEALFFCIMERDTVSQRYTFLPILHFSLFFVFFFSFFFTRIAPFTIAVLLSALPLDPRRLLFFFSFAYKFANRRARVECIRCEANRIHICRIQCEDLNVELRAPTAG